MVEPMGFEPTTSSMPSRRAPNCATAPPEELQKVYHRLARSRGGGQALTTPVGNIAGFSSRNPPRFQ